MMAVNATEILKKPLYGTDTTKELRINTDDTTP